MNVIIKHIDIHYVDHTTFDDPEPDLIPIEVDVHFEMIQGQNLMPGKTTLAYDDYEIMNHRELTLYVQREQQRHLQAFQPSK